jgi:PTH1 family peptidyl-tRNA hydrolase
VAYGLIVGLGNPGKEYDSTRHNVGFRVIDAFVEQHGGRWTLEKKFMARIAVVPSAGKNMVVAKPETFMNESGMAVARLCNYHKILPEETVVVYDDIAFPVGDFRINEREGTGGHNGVADVLSRVGGGFVRYRIGVGAKGNRQMLLRDHVLSRFTDDELQILKNKMPEILKYLQLLLDKGAEYAMNLANQKKNYE